MRHLVGLPPSYPFFSLSKLTVRRQAKGCVHVNTLRVLSRFVFPFSRWDMGVLSQASARY